MKSVNLILERCCTSLEQVREAAECGAARVELCENLEVGGVTPSEELIRAAVGVCGIAVNVLVRPRGGSFVWSSDEIAQMEESIRLCRDIGADGVVIGALTPEGEVDMPAMQRLVRVARKDGRPQAAPPQAAPPQAAPPQAAPPQAEMHRGLSVTFHRAFDCAADPFRALEDVIALGCDRLLTSGQQPTAPEGRELLKSLVHAADGRIIVMPGSGVTPQNLGKLASYCGAVEFHGTRLGRRSEPCDD